MVRCRPLRCPEYAEALESRGRIAKLLAQRDRLLEALDSIRQYGADTLSGRVDGPDDREWQREAVREMTERAEAVIAACEEE